MTTLIATSVVRGSHQGESHGGVYLIDLDGQQVVRVIDWNTMDIDWQGRGWDRGLRGIEFDGDRIYIAASDELFVFDPQFRRIGSHRNPYLKHAHEICRYDRMLFVASTGYDSILGFHLDKQSFTWGLHVTENTGGGFEGLPFDPSSTRGPPPGNRLHLNNIFCNDRGMYLSGMRTGAALVFTGREIARWVSLPQGAHNARPHRDGVLFNDTQANLVRFATRTTESIFRVPSYDPARLTHTDLDDSRIARQAFGRGLCVIDDGVIAAGSSPSTVAVHDLDSRKTRMVVTLTFDVRNAIHGLEVWSY